MGAPRPDTFKGMLEAQARRIARLERAAGRRRPAPVFTTADRPDPVEFGVGYQIYDRTLLRPLWSDGSTWRDAAGNVV